MESDLKLLFPVTTILLIVCRAEVRRNRSKCTASHSSQIPSEVQDKAQQNFPSDVTSTEPTVTQTAMDSPKYDSLFGYKFRFDTHLPDSVPCMVCLSAVKGCSGDVDSWRLSCKAYGRDNRDCEIKIVCVIFFGKLRGVQ